MSLFSSVSKGCFVYNKRKTKKKSLCYGCKNRENKSNLPTFAGFDRAALFKLLWETFDGAIEAAKLRVYTNFLGELIQFIIKNGESSNKRVLSGEIPTALFVAGVSVPDHDSLYSSLKEMLRRKTTYAFASLSNEDTRSTKDSIQKIVSTVIKGTSGEELQKYKCTMPVLAAWYKSYYLPLNNSSPNKHSMVSKRMLTHALQHEKHGITKNSFPPIIIVLEDLERCPVDVINDLILILSEYASQLPLILVVGVSTSVNVLHHILLPLSLSKLVMKIFKAPGPNDYLNFIVDEVLLNSKLPLKMSDRLFRLLEDRFTRNNFSIATFISGLKFFVMDYFYTSPLSVLCCNVKDASERIKILDKCALEEVRQLLSFRTYVENSPPKLQKLMLLDDTYLKSVIELLITEIHDYHQYFFPLLRFLLVLTNGLPNHPRRQLRDIYKVCLEKNLNESPEFQDCLEMLRQMPKENLSIKLKESLDCLKKYKELPSSILTLISSIETVIRKLDGCDESNDTVKATTTFEMSKAEAIFIIESSVRKYLRSPKHLTLYEIMYFDNLKMKPNLVGNNQGAIQTALGDPHHYLKCQCCVLDSPGSISSRLLDLCVAYKLHLECPRIINLWDLLQAFISVVDPQLQPDLSNNSHQNKLLMTRFFCALTELQLLGFIQQLERNTNIVVRVM